MSSDRSCCKTAKYSRYSVIRTEERDAENSNKTTYKFYLVKVPFRINHGGWRENSFTNNDWSVLLDTIVIEDLINTDGIYQEGNHNVSVYSDGVDEYAYIFMYKVYDSYVRHLHLIKVHINSQLVMYNKVINFSTGVLTMNDYSARVTDNPHYIKIADYGCLGFKFNSPRLLYRGGHGVGYTDQSVLVEDVLYMLITPNKIILTNMSYKTFSIWSFESDTYGSIGVATPEVNIDTLYVWLQIDTSLGVIEKEYYNYTDYHNKFQLLGRETKIIHDLDKVAGIKLEKYEDYVYRSTVVIGKLDLTNEPKIINHEAVDAWLVDKINRNSQALISWGQSLNHTFMCVQEISPVGDGTYTIGSKIFIDSVHAGEYAGGFFILESELGDRRVRTWIEPCFSSGYIYCQEYVYATNTPLEIPGYIVLEKHGDNGVIHWTKTFNIGYNDRFLHWYQQWYFNLICGMYFNDKYVIINGVPIDPSTQITPYDVQIDSGFKYTEGYYEHLDENDTHLYWRNHCFNLNVGFYVPVSETTDPAEAGSHYWGLPEYQNKLVYTPYDDTIQLPSSDRMYLTLNMIRISGLQEAYFSPSD